MASTAKSRLRGRPRDSPQVRVSKTLSWLLRHGAKGERLSMRTDGFVKVSDLVATPKLRNEHLDLGKLKEIVSEDSKQRYTLISEVSATGDEEWWIKANQGHSIKTVELVMKPITTVTDIPSGIAVHGTTLKAWNSIRVQGLSRMSRNHIHLAQGVVGGKSSVVSGMRTSSEIMIFIDVAKALDAGIKFFLSDNGVVLTEGDERGFLIPEFFQRVENGKRVEITGWNTSAFHTNPPRDVLTAQQ